MASQLKEGPHDPESSTVEQSSEHKSNPSVPREPGRVTPEAEETKPEHSSLKNTSPKSTSSGKSRAGSQKTSPKGKGKSKSKSRTPSPRETSPPGAHPGGYTSEEAAEALDQAEQGIDVISEQSDEGFETDSLADSVSLASSARNFIFENGRRYHGYRAGSYSFPNDDREQDREDLKHAMYLLLFNKTLHFAPLEVEKRPGMRAIDLGTGTGIWAIDFADQYPTAEVLGVDLSPIQTTWVPPNLKFMVDDVESEWLYPLNHFDYIHTRHTVQAFRKWELLLTRAFRHLKPGSWIELQEINHFPECDDNSLLPTSPLVQYWTHICTGLTNLGVDILIAPQLPALLRRLGYTNVTHRTFYTPIGPWPKNRALREVGLYWRAVLGEGVEAIALGPMTRGLGWRREEVEVFLSGVRKSYEARGVHAWMPFHVVYGQKPGGG